MTQDPRQTLPRIETTMSRIEDSMTELTTATISTQRAVDKVDRRLVKFEAHLEHMPTTSQMKDEISQVVRLHTADCLAQRKTTSKTPKMIPVGELRDRSAGIQLNWAALGKFMGFFIGGLLTALGVVKFFQ